MRTEHARVHAIYKMLLIIIFIVSLFFSTFRLSFAPCMIGDEYVFFSVAKNLAEHGALVTYTGKTWFAQPPLFFFPLATYLKILGLTTSSINIDSILQARGVSAFFLALSTTGFFLLGLKLKNLKLALMISTFYLLDPFILGQGRLGSIDTLSIFLSIFSIYLFLVEKHLSAGIAVGATLLTKEISGLSALMVMLTYCLLAKYYLRNGLKLRPKDIRLTVLISFYIYLIYVVWALWFDPVAFIEAKTYALRKLIGLAPGRELAFVGEKWYFTTRIIEKAGQCLITYLIVALSIPLAVYTFYLIFSNKINDPRETESLAFVLSFFIGNYVLLALLQCRNSQYFITPIMSSMLMVGYILTVFASHMSLHDSFQNISDIDACVVRLSNKRRFLLVALFIFISLSYNLHVWYEYYGIGDDRVYQKIIQYIETNVPENSTIWGHYFVVVFLSDKYHVYSDWKENSLKKIVDKKINYFIWCPFWEALIEEDLYTYIVTNGTYIFGGPSQANKYIDIYYIQEPI